MRVSKLAMAAAASLMTVAPVAVQAAPVERAAEPAAEENELGRSALWIVIAVAIGVALYFLVIDDNDPVSP